MGLIARRYRGMSSIRLIATRPSTQLGYNALTRHFVGRVKHATTN